MLKIIAIVSFTVGTLISCNSSSGFSDDNPIRVPRIDESATKVTTVPAELRAFDYTIKSNGKIKPLQEQLIISEYGGRLMILNARPGQAVLKNDLIGKLETDPILFKLDKAKSQRFNSSKEYESQLLGYENLLKGKSEEEASVIQQKLKISTGLTQAEQDIKELNYELAKSIIRAPFNGVLADIKVQSGEYLKPGQELFRVYNPYSLCLEVKILESDITLLKKGTFSIVTPISQTNFKYAAEVHEINPYIDENGLVMVKLKIVKPQSLINRLFPGMNCIALIQVPLEKGIVIPKEAVVMRSGKTVVFSLEDGKAKWNFVTVGRDNGKEVEIKSGLRAGMKIITTNNLQLTHDTPVQEDLLGTSN